MESPKHASALRRGELVIAHGILWAVVAVIGNSAWLTTGQPWGWLRVELVGDRARVPDRFCANAPWEIN